MTFTRKLGLVIMLVGLFWVERPQPRNIWVFDSGSLLEGKLSAIAAIYLTPNKADLDSDGKLEFLCIASGQAVITHAPCTNGEYSQPLWSSPHHWQVIQGMLTDLNRDGRIEATLLVWRPYERWAIDSFLLHPGRLDGFQNDQGLSCHVILIGTKPNRPGLYRELWAGSAMAAPFESFAAGDVNGDGHQELVALEGDYEDNIYKAGYALTLWEWNGFGFSLLARINGNFRNMELVSSPQGKVYILTQG